MCWTARYSRTSVWAVRFITSTRWPDPVNELCQSYVVRTLISSNHEPRVLPESGQAGRLNRYTTHVDSNHTSTVDISFRRQMQGSRFYHDDIRADICEISAMLLRSLLQLYDTILMRRKHYLKFLISFIVGLCHIDRRQVSVVGAPRYILEISPPNILHPCRTV